MRLQMFAAALLFALAATACGGAQPQPTAATEGPTRPAEATCPVMGKAFAPGADTQFAEYKGQTYWFCCPGCREKFLAEPEKFLTPAAPAAPTPAPAAATQATCPVSGETFVAGPNTPTLQHEGKTLQFCCPGCLEKFKADPAKYAAGPCADKHDCDCKSDGTVQK